MKKRGFSLIEVVIALTILAIMSIATVTLIVTSVDVESENIARNNAVRDGENIVECFSYADDLLEFSQCLNKAGYTTVPSALELNKNYVVCDEVYLVEFTILSEDKIEISAYFDGKEIYKVEYDKKL